MSTGSVRFESCVDSLASALASERGGASRVELCANLDAGGTTPAPFLIEAVTSRLRIPVFVMIRQRAGDFVYNDADVQAMEADARAAVARGATGVVLGALRRDATVDAEITRRLVDAARPLPVTFHRAFDVAGDLDRALEALLTIGVDRVLTSGGAPSAREGAGTIARLVARGGGRVTVVAGGLVRADHVAALVAKTGVREVHARLVEPDPLTGEPITTEAQVAAFMRALAAGRPNSPHSG